MPDDCTTPEDIETAARVLFYKKRVFNDKYCLFDAMAAFGMPRFAVGLDGKRLVCLCSNPRRVSCKPVMEPGKPNDLMSSKNQKRGESKSSLKLGCGFQLNFQRCDQKNSWYRTCYDI